MSLKCFLLALVFITPFVHTNSTTLKQKNIYQQYFPELLKNINVENPTQTEKKLITACQLIDTFGIQYTDISDNHIQTLCDLHFFTDIIQLIKRTKTQFGHLALCQQAAQMNHNIHMLTQQSAIIHEIHTNHTLQEALLQDIDILAQLEPDFLDLTNIDSFQNLYYQKYCLHLLNENATFLELTNRATQLSISIPLILKPILIKLYSKAALDPLSILEDGLNLYQQPYLQKAKTISNFSKIALSDYYSYFLINLPKTVYNNHIFTGLKSTLSNLENNKASLIAAGITTLVYSLITWYAYNEYKGFIQDLKSQKEFFDNIYKQQKTLIKISSLVRTLQSLSSTINQNSILQSNLDICLKLQELFNPQSIHVSNDLKNLIQALLSSSFQGSPSYLLSQQGKILATYHLLTRSYTELVPYLQMAGTIDALLSTTQLYEESYQHPKAQICLASFVNNDKPVFIAQNFWHPLIDQQKVVTNTLIIDNENKKINLIITGPNAGGKTTSLTAILINTLMAQSFGIAFAANLALTPFAKINSCIDITTNLIKGESLFKAEVNRLKRVKNSIISGSSNEKVLTIIDELLSGTEQNIASNLGFEFATQMGAITHSMLIITTHFPRLTELESETSSFSNYKVADAIINQHGKISYPFKLVPGISGQNIAQFIMQDEGLLQ